MTGDKPDYGALYSSHCLGEFYGADYYKPLASDIESAIIYDDNEDKRVLEASVSVTGRHAFEPITGAQASFLIKSEPL